MKITIDLNSRERALLLRALHNLGSDALDFAAGSSGTDRDYMNNINKHAYKLAHKVRGVISDAIEAKHLAMGDDHARRQACA